MTLNDFKALIETFGANPRHWPEAHQDALSAFVKANPGQANAILEQERDVDALIGTYDAPQPSDLLSARILRTLPEQPAIRVQTSRSTSKLLSWGSIAAALGIGAVLGFGGAQFGALDRTPATTDPAITQSVETALTYSDIAELDELGFLELYAWTQDVEIDTLDLSGVDTLLSQDTL